MMIKPASSLCNLRCRYCFYHDLAENRDTASYGIMTRETMENLIDRAVECLPAGENQLSLIFQGGEPLLAGPGFFEALEEKLKSVSRRSLHITRSLQTNGTLIDDGWAAHFARYGYLVGVSLDGNAQLHNSLRVTPDGKGSFSAVTRGISVLEKHRVPYNILCVVTNDMARHGAQVYRFLRKNGWDYLQFIPCMDPVSGERMPWSLSGEAYGRFLTEIYNEYERELLSGRRVSVRWFDNLLDMLTGHMPESCGMTGVCACHFVIEADGSVYPCDFYVDDAHRLGDLRDTGFRKMYDSDTARRFIEASRETAPECEKCPWYAICRGGCRRYRDDTENGPGLSRLCPAYRLFFETCGGRLQELARRLSAAQR